MKQRLYLFVIIPAIAISLSSGCRKKLETFHLKPETLSYCNFRIGSFWVYRDQFGKIDTVGVLKYNRKMTSSHRPYEIEMIEMYLEPTKSEQLFSHEIDILQDKWHATVYHSLPEGSTHMETIYTEKLDSLAGFKGEIKHFVINGSSLRDSIRTIEEYRMKNVGVIRRIFKDGRQQELIDYKVIQD